MIILLYKLFSKKIGDKLKIDASECGVCDACADVCPLGVIKKKAYKMIVEEGCDNCGECLEVCPVGCITLDE